jgi:hypothetical protein
MPRMYLTRVIILLNVSAGRVPVPQDLAFRDMMGLAPEDLVKTQWKGTALQCPGRT